MMNQDAEIKKNIDILAPASVVWSALTNPDSIQRWMHDSELSIVSDWKVGSPIVFRGNLHGIDFENRGTIQRFEPEKVFQYNCWSTLSISMWPDAPENYMTIRFVLTPMEAGKTNVALTLSGFADDVIRKHVNLYWGVALDDLRKFCEAKA